MAKNSEKEKGGYPFFEVIHFCAFYGRSSPDLSGFGHCVSKAGHASSLRPNKAL
jgi:hypothetical protein